MWVGGWGGGGAEGQRGGFGVSRGGACGGQAIAAVLLGLTSAAARTRGSGLPADGQHRNARIDGAAPFIGREASDVCTAGCTRQPYLHRRFGRI